LKSIKIFVEMRLSDKSSWEMTFPYYFFWSKFKPHSVPCCAFHKIFHHTDDYRSEVNLKEVNPFIANSYISISPFIWGFKYIAYVRIVYVVNMQLRRLWSMQWYHFFIQMMLTMNMKIMETFLPWGLYVRDADYYN